VLRTPFAARRGAALLLFLASVVAFGWLMPAAGAQGSAAITVDPNSGSPTPAANVAQPCPANVARPAWCFNITFTQFHECPSGQTNCIIVDFIQGGTPIRIGTADPRGSSSFSGTLAVPPAATAGAATIHAHSSTDDAPLVGFTVTAAPAPTTATTVPGTTTSSSSTSSTTALSTTTLTTVVPPLTEPPTTIAAKTTSSSSHSDVPRYIAVAPVVLAAAATAAVDTRQRRLRAPDEP
jgi:hypothetical protein